MRCIPDFGAGWSVVVTASFMELVLSHFYPYYSGSVMMVTKDEMIYNEEDCSALEVLFVEFFHWLGEVSEN